MTHFVQNGKDKVKIQDFSTNSDMDEGYPVLSNYLRKRIRQGLQENRLKSLTCEHPCDNVCGDPCDVSRCKICEKHEMKQ